MSTFESTEFEAFPEQTDSREVVARKVLHLAIVGAPPPPRWLVPVRGGRGGAGVREGEKAASDSPLLSDSPLRITPGDPQVGEVRGRGVSFLTQVHRASWG